MAKKSEAEIRKEAAKKAEAEVQKEAAKKSEAVSKDNTLFPEKYLDKKFEDGEDVAPSSMLSNEAAENYL